MLEMRRTGVTVFDPLPEWKLALAWPTRSRSLFADENQYIARTRVNPNYGKPGWTRDCGWRFHRGVDIAPVQVRSAGRSVTVQFSDCSTGREYPSDESAWVPDDEVFAVLPGRVMECNVDEAKSDFGLFVVLEHQVPDSEPIFTLYAHLARVDVLEGVFVQGGALLGRMGQTSRNEDARNWMAIAPHLHFEVISSSGGAYDPLEFLRRGLSGGE